MKEFKEGEWHNDYELLLEARKYLRDHGHYTSLEEIDDLIDYLKLHLVIKVD